MSKLITMTVSDRLYAAIQAEGMKWEKDVPGWLKMQLEASALTPQGVNVKLNLPPLPEGALPLFELAGVSATGASSEGGAGV